MAIITEEHTWTPGTAAVTKDFELAKAPIHAIILNLDALSETNALTYANMLVQFGTKIYLKDGAGTVTPEWSGTELAEYQEAFLCRNAPHQDGTAANNKLALTQIVIPCGRPFLGNAGFPLDLLDPQVGYNPRGTPFLHMSVPADGNDIDNRHVKVIVVYGTSRFPYSKRWTRWTDQTVSTTGWTDWIIGDSGLLLEALIFETSEYNATLASDAPSILDWRIERRGKNVFTDGDVPNVLGAMLDDDTHADDEYKYMVLSKVPLGMQNCIRLAGETKFRVYGGVADSVKMAFSVMNALTK